MCGLNCVFTAQHMYCVVKMHKHCCCFLLYVQLTVLIMALIWSFYTVFTGDTEEYSLTCSTSPSGHILCVMNGNWNAESPFVCCSCFYLLNVLCHWKHIFLITILLLLVTFPSEEKVIQKTSREIFNPVSDYICCFLTWFNLWGFDL